MDYLKNAWSIISGLPDIIASFLTEMTSIFPPFILTLLAVAVGVSLTLVLVKVVIELL